MNTNVKTAQRIPLAVSVAMLLSGSWVATRALAEEPVRSEVVKFHDLNVNTPEGVKALYGRIHAAARRVCSETDPMLALGAPACARKAEVNAIEKLNLPQLTAYYKLQGSDRPILIAGR